MQKDSQPLAILYGYSSKKDQISFVGRRGIITLSGNVTRIKKILRYCNGINNVQDIMNKMLTSDLDEVSELLALCETYGIVRDSREVYIGFHEDSANPGIFSYDLGNSEVASIMKSQRLRERDGIAIQLPKYENGNILKTIRKRQSIRQFQNAKIPANKLSGVLEATYSIDQNGHWSVPSGGAMYPLDLYLIIPNECQVLAQGIYRWNPEKNEVTVISDKDPNVWLSKAFNAHALLENAACILCIAANLKRSASKYANRGYRYILLESGHAAQNAYLFCAEQDIGVVEYCGFSDETIARELGLLFPDEAVITTLIMGIENKAERRSYTTDEEVTETAHRLRLALVGDGKPIEDISFWEPRVNGYSMPQWTAVASYRPPCGHVTESMKEKCRAFATGYISSEAILKALAEGFERYALEERRSDQVECAVNLSEPFIDPRLIVPYASVQQKILKGIEKFDPEKKIGWVAGVREVGGSPVWVPTDLVFYSNRHLQDGEKVCYQASSSGVAAHFDKQVAIKTALYELIERDAISVTWYTKRHVHAIPREYVSSSMRERMSRWESFGYNASLFDLTLDGVPVVLAAIWAYNKKPALFSGAGCRSTLIDAASRAFDEAEFMAMTWYHRKIKRNMNMVDVWSPDDHGLFYMDSKNLIHAEWLLKAEESRTITQDFNGDLHCFDPIVVDITPKGYNCGLTVVRVLSEKLMPINFGYGTEHYGHPRIDMLGLQWNWDYPSIPHFFA